MKTNEFFPYICPKCKSSLNLMKKFYSCGICHNKYVIENNIADFLTPVKSEDDGLILESVEKIDILAKIYEKPIWYPLIYHIYGGIRIPSVKNTITTISKMLNYERGIGLDVACGTGLYTRAIAKRLDYVYGVDISKGMLEKANKIAEKEKITNIEFAKAMVEKLPFPNRFFDAACCTGALHLFPDTFKALKEIARVLKTGSYLAVMTFVRKRFLKYRFIYKHLKEKHGATIFNVADLKKWLKLAGFTDFNSLIYGSMILFRARRK